MSVCRTASFVLFKFLCYDHIFDENNWKYGSSQLYGPWTHSPIKYDSYVLLICKQFVLVM